MKLYNLRYLITGIILGILFFSFQPQQIFAFSFFKPPKPPIPPRPTIIIPTRIPIKWFIKPIKNLTPTITPSPTTTPTPTVQQVKGMLAFERVNQNPIKTGDNFQVKILINTTGLQTIGADALVGYDSNKVTINSANSGNFYTYFEAISLPNKPNKYLVSGWEENSAYSKSSNAHVHFATMNLTAKEIGNTSISFDCTPGSIADSNIFRDSDATDILNCNGLMPITINIE